MLYALVAKAELTAGSAVVLADDIPNPLDGVKPNIDVFGVKFNNAVTLALGGAWAICLLVCVFFMIKNGAAWAGARQRGMSDDMTDGMTGFKRAALGFAAVAGIGVLVGGILALIGML